MSDLKVTRLTPEREAMMRRAIRGDFDSQRWTNLAWAQELLAEIDALRAELASARADRDLVEAEFLKERAPALAKARAEAREELRAHSDELWEAHAQGDEGRISSAIYDLRQEFRKG